MFKIGWKSHYNESVSKLLFPGRPDVGVAKKKEGKKKEGSQQEGNHASSSSFHVLDDR